MYLIILVFFTIILSYLIYKFNFSNHNLFKELNGKNVIVTGGSSGIGKSLSKICFQNGSNIILISRDIKKLESVKEEIEKYRCNKNQFIYIFPTDISNNEQVKKIFQYSINTLERIDVLINCAGTSIASEFEKTSVEKFEYLMQLNFFGSVYMTKNVVEQMKENKQGKIIFVSSMAGLIGLYGYTAYSASKAALIGFAKSLQMELGLFNIQVLVSFPPDTDTPGFEEEEKIKPLGTKLISEAGGLFNPHDVAEKILQDSLNNKFTSTIGLNNHLVRIATSGTMPVTNILEFLFDVFFIGFCKFISGIYLLNCNYILRKLIAKNS